MSRKWKDMAWLTWWVIVIGFVLSFGVSDMHAGDPKSRFEIAVTYGKESQVRHWTTTEDKRDLIRIIQQEKVYSVTFFNVDADYPVLEFVTIPFSAFKHIVCTEGYMYFSVSYDEEFIKTVKVY